MGFNSVFKGLSFWVLVHFFFGLLVSVSSYVHGYEKCDRVSHLFRLSVKSPDVCHAGINF
jgi:hypothetical protein